MSAKPFVLSLAVLLASVQPMPAQTRVAIETELGTLEVRLEDAKAPRTTANFLRYVDAGAYRNGVFHRTVTPGNQPQSPVKIQVIQGGAASENHDLPPIALERTRDTGLRHVDGAISMARGGPDTATSDFFICVGDQPELDFGGRRNPDGQGFAAFGRVVKGLEIVRAIQARPAQGQRLEPPVKILAVRRLENVSH